MRRGGLTVLTMAMDLQRIPTALARIEAAAERIAASARRPPPRAADPELARRHRRLQEEAGAALAELDQLILELEQ